MDKIREEFEKIATYHIDAVHNNIGIYTIPEEHAEGVWCRRSDVERFYYFSQKSRDEEIKKLRDAMEEIRDNIPRGQIGLPYKIAYEALKDGE